MYAYPWYPKRQTLRLDGIWDFTFLGENIPQLEKIDVAMLHYTEVSAVPGCFDAAPKYAGKRGVAAYRTSVRLPSGKHLRLRLGGLGLRGRLLWDNRDIGLNELPYSEQEYYFDTDDHPIHQLVVLIDNRLDFNDTPLFHHFYDFYGYGGIYRSLVLEILPDTGHFGRVQVETLDLSGRVRLSGTWHGNAAPVLIGFDDDKLRPVDAEVVGEHFIVTTQLPNPSLWSPEHPSLHTVMLQSADDVILERFGLRTVRCADSKILLNDKPIRLCGYNRHDAHPQFGPAMPDELWIEDLQILRDLGCNFIRGSHYPQSQRFLDLCDQMGFLVWEESLGWGDNVAVQSDSKFRRLQIEQTVNMVKCSFNHPSVVMWGFMNEPGDNKEVGASLLRELAATVKSIDHNRPVTFASMYIKDSLALDAFDIISFNIYPGWYEADNTSDPRPLHRIAEVLDEILFKLDQPKLRGKPLIISEIGAGGIYGWRDRIRGIWSEEYQADYLDKVCRYFKSHSRLSGLALWQFCDGRTYAASNVLGRPRAFNNKGTLDEYRRPKLAYDTVKIHFQNLDKEI